MPTRNSPLWWLGMAAGLLPLVLDQLSLLHIDPIWGDRLKFLGFVVAFLSAYFRMSPLSLSPDSTLAGRSAPARTLAPFDSGAPKRSKSRSS